MVAQLAEAYEVAEVVDLRPAPAPELDEALEALAVAAEQLAAAVAAAPERGVEVRPELAMLSERATKAAHAGTLYRAKHYPRRSRLGTY
jgi:hypothetical protein